MKSIHFNHKTAVIAALIIGLIGAIAAGNRTAIKNRESEEEIQQGIANEILRFHVLANSDTESDQKLKLQVKTEVIEYLEDILADSHSLEETKESVLRHMDGIVKEANQTIQSEGYAYPVTAKITKTYFPQKTYGDCTFPAGEYEALQIQIGEAQGKNWWCVLYPSLCFIDATHGIVTEEKKEELKNLLTEEEFNTVMKNPDVKISFRWFN